MKSLPKVHYAHSRLHIAQYPLARFALKSTKAWRTISCLPV